MKTTIIAAAIASILAAPALAQDYNASNSAQSQSHSQSGSAINRGGDTVYSSTAIAPSMGTTAPCVIGKSGGIGALGVGVSVGGGSIHDPCEVKDESHILMQLGKMHPDDPARRIAIMHFCTNNDRMYRTLAAAGWCVRP